MAPARDSSDDDDHACESQKHFARLGDAVVFSDLIVEKTSEGYEAREATTRLKKHS